MSHTTLVSTMSASTASSTGSSTLYAVDLDDESRVVRFDKECVLIPESLLTKRPILVTKSYSIPVWKRRPSGGPSEDQDDGEGSLASSPTFKVPVPSFMAKHSASPTRGREPSKPLSPCLVHRSPSSPATPTGHRPWQRRTSLPSTARNVSPVISNRYGKLQPLNTVPLRACCPNCFHVTEKCLQEGDHWKEKFSRGARRRRSSSCSSDDFSMGPAPTSLSSFASVIERVPTKGPCSKVSIKVDEVDKKHNGPTITPTEEDAASGTENPGEETPVKSSHPPIPRASPIQEEDDDDQLFPLPSPRRTPSSSPAGSENTSPLASPNPSSSALVSSSRESLNNSSGSDDGLIPRSLSRKGGARCEKGLLMPDSSYKPSSDTQSTSSPTKPKPTITIPSTPNHHIRIASSPIPSPTTHEFQRSVSSHSRSATSPETNQLHGSTPTPKSRHYPLTPESPSRRPSKTIAKKRSQGFSPSAFFKEALKGVSSMSTGGTAVRGF